MRLTTEDAEDADRLPLTGARGDIAFEDVVFSYDEGVPVLRGISFAAPAGTTTALVGSSGSGKSTLISLVNAFNRPDSGRVLVDGADLATLRLRDYRSRLGVVLQENFLFDGTIAENIAYGRPHSSRAEIEDAGRIANCEEFVSGFEKGYDTVIGERGVKLSGGQRQRLAIARAILANPDILILDEATSSLDSESEAAIQDALAHLRSGRTTFVIAHRLFAGAGPRGVVAGGGEAGGDEAEDGEADGEAEARAAPRLIGHLPRKPRRGRLHRRRRHPRRPRKPPSRPAGRTTAPRPGR